MSITPLIKYVKLSRSCPVKLRPFFAILRAQNYATKRSSSIAGYSLKDEYRAFKIRSPLEFCRFYAKSSYPPHQIINMPSLSPTMTQGNLGIWKKRVGDKLVPGDVIAEIETDKATMDFECQEEGYIASILVPSNTKDVQVNTPLCIITDNDSDVAAFKDYRPTQETPVAHSKISTQETNNQENSAEIKPLSSSKAKSDDTSKQNREATSQSQSQVEPMFGSKNNVFASPYARTLAAQNNVDISKVQQLQSPERITASDIQSYLQTKQQQSSTPLTGSSLSTYLDIPLSSMRKVIAQRLLQSKTTIPHYYLTMEVNMDEILALRQKFADAKLSVNDFIVKASAMACKAVPAVNTHWIVEKDEPVLRHYASVDVSVAVATENGLITPIVFGADSSGLSSISQRIKDLAERAKIGKLMPQEYQGGTFTVSNLGMYGITSFSAIINPPQSAILAVGGAVKKLVKTNDDLKQITVLNATLSCDHRVIDGATGAKWLNTFKSYLEEPMRMLL